MQGLLELAGVPYVGSGVTRIGALHGQGPLQGGAARPRASRSPRNVTLRPGDAVENPFGYPVFVKPARLGSSVGISKVAAEDELAAAVALARRHDDKVLVEEFVPGMEVECGVLGNREPDRLGRRARSSRTPTGTTIDAKYDEGGMELDRARRRHLRRRRASACSELAVAVVRGDRLRGHGARRLLRPPGRRGRRQRAEHDPRASRRRASTPSSSRRAAIAYAELLDRLVELALERHERRARARVLASSAPTTAPRPSVERERLFPGGERLVEHRRPRS